VLTAEELKKKIESTEDLQSVVKTMKALAAVNIRQYERAVESLADYTQAVEMGLRIVLQSGPFVSIMAKSAPQDHIGVLVFGSDQGMCGQLNDQIVSHALKSMDDLGAARENRTVLAIGARATGRLEDAGQPVEESFSVPSSTAGITPLVQEILVILETWSSQKGINQLYVFYNRHLSGASFRPHSVRLLPVDEDWLSALKKEPWPSRCLPTYTMDRDMLFSSLIRQYLFISLFRGFAESLASENASRLASMQRAERNIEDRLSELSTQFHRQRQMSITEELLDIVSGFEALKE
jgi:F-type H+-transporting ATPase subunit gamma